MSDEQEKIIFDANILDSLQEAIGDKVNHIISVYLEDFPLTLRHMRTATENLEYETVGRFAHSLKSSSASIGVMQVSAIAAKLEQSMKAGLTNKSDITEAMNELETSFSQARPMLIKYIG